MQYLITKEFAERLKDHLAGAIDEVDEADALYQEIQSLPVLEGEPVAWQIKFKDEHGTQRNVTYIHNAIGDYRQIDPNAICEPLYTHPAPFTPITADMVTDEMIESINCGHSEIIEQLNYESIHIRDGAWKTCPNCGHAVKDEA